MFKRALIKLCKVFIALALIIGTIMVVRYFTLRQAALTSFGKTRQDKKLTVITNESLKQLMGNGLQKVQENSNLELYINFNDGNVEVLNKSTGFTWRSKPASDELAKEKSNDLWRGNLESPVMIEYIDSIKKAASVIGNIKNQNAEVKIFKLQEGVRVCIDFKTSQIKIGYDLTLNNDNLEVSIPYYLTQEYGTNKLVGYSILPFFGAVRSENNNDGYLFVPDGPGGLIKFDENKVYKDEYIGKVYGDDTTLIISGNNPKQWVYYPVYGIKNGSNSLVAVIDEGESTAEIHGVPANIKTGFNAAYSRFIYRTLYRVNTDLTGGGYLRFTENGNTESRKLYYYFLKDDKSNYMGMAEAYRHYLMEQQGLKRKKAAGQNLPLQLVIFGGDIKEGLFGSSFVKTTTFEEAKSIIEGFYHMGIERMDIVFEGWSKDGAGTRYPDRFPVEKKLGGNKGLTELVKICHKLGHNFFLMDNNAEASSIKYISKRREAVYSIHKIPMTQGNKKEIFNINTSAIERLLKKSIPIYKQYGVDGIEEEALAALLTTDFNPYSPFTRTQEKEEYSRYFDMIRSELGGIRVKKASAYCLANISTITDMPDSYSYYAVIDEMVPFYHIAIHGLLDYVTKPYNFFDEPRKEILKAIEYGANVNFVVTMENTVLLRETKSSSLYSTQFDLLRNDIKYQYNRINKALSGVQDQFIISHEDIGKDVKRVVYENGKEIVINYSSLPVQYKGMAVPSMDYGVFEGEVKK